MVQSGSSTQQKFLLASPRLDDKLPTFQVENHQEVHLSSSALEI
jgi:hypothetical protein